MRAPLEAAANTLKGLTCNHKQLTALPPSLKDLYSIQRLSLSSNKIKQLPSDISLLTALRRLALSNNDLQVLSLLALLVQKHKY